jgi:hypothetical protein
VQNIHEIGGNLPYAASLSTWFGCWPYVRDEQ